MLSAPARVEEVAGAGPPGGPRASTAWVRAGVAAGVVLAVAWLSLRPGTPTGLAAVVDLLALPALLLAEVRLLAGPTTVAPSGFALFFGVGAVFGGLSATVLERAAGSVAGRPGVDGAGPLVEAVALAAPLVLVAVLAAGGRRWTVADLSFAGLCSGAGFLLVQASLATGALHAAPSYESPLLAGLQRLPASAGSPPVYFVGPALATALVGLALGVGLRWLPRAWRWVPAGLALALVVADHSLFAWRLRHLVASEAAPAPGWAEVVRAVTLDGRLALALLVGGLVAVRFTAGGPAPVLDLRDAAEGGGLAEPAVTPQASGAVPAGGGDDRQPDGGPAPPGGEEAQQPLRSGRDWVAPALAGGCGLGIALAARRGQLGFLDSRALGMAVSLAGLAYSLWNLPARPGRRPEAALRFLLGAAAVASSALGLVCAVLPTPDAARPAHGGLILDTVLGWGAGVGNLGVVLGLGGLAAPAGGRGNRRFGDRWSAYTRRRFRWAGRFGAGRQSRPGGGHERDSGRGGDGRRRQRLEQGHGGGWFWWARLRLRLGGRSRAGATDPPPAPARPEAASVSIAIEPVHRASQSQGEFVGPTVKEAIEAAMRASGLDLAHSSLQLVDEGSPARPGKPGTGRPARVRVWAAEGPGEGALVPPGRDSITRDTPFVVAVGLAGWPEGELPPALEVTVRAAHNRRSHPRTLACARVDSPPDRAHYRSNPYSVEDGEDITWARSGQGHGVAAGGIHVENGEELSVHHRGQRASVTVYDGWAQQVVAVNRWLLDLTGAHHRGALATLAARLDDAGGSGDRADHLRAQVRRLEARLRCVEQAQRLLDAVATDDPAPRHDDLAVRSTALLHAAMSVEDGEVEVGPDATDRFGAFLARTTPGLLWRDGARTRSEVADALGWARFTAEPATDGPGPQAAGPVPESPAGDVSGGRP